MKKVEMISEITAMLTQMAPVLNQMGVGKQFQIPDKADKLPYEVVQKAYKWLASKHPSWKAVNFYYIRHPEEHWDNLLDSEFPLNEVECFLRESAVFRKALKKRPDFFKHYITTNLLRKKHGNAKRPVSSSAKD